MSMFQYALANRSEAFQRHAQRELERFVEWA